MVRIASFNVENLFCAAQGIQYHQLVRWPASPERLSRGQHSDLKPHLQHSGKHSKTYSRFFEHRRRG